MNVSVAMAAYNGEKYISNQIDSILLQLKDTDELVISLNPSTDKTEEIISTYVNKDTRVKFFICPKKGVLNNFENALMHCNNEIVFLSDQDDVWHENKVQKILYYFRLSEVVAVAHKPMLVDAKLQPLTTVIEKTHSEKTVAALNIIYKNCIQGSCLAFRRNILKYALPFPSKLPMHDSWLGIVAASLGKVILVSDELILYRQHESNVTSRNHQRIGKMLKDRLQLFMAFLNLRFKIMN